MILLTNYYRTVWRNILSISINKWMGIDSKCFIFWFIASPSLSLKLITKQNNLNYFDLRSRTLSYNINTVACISYLK